MSTVPTSSSVPGLMAERGFVEHACPVAAYSGRVSVIWDLVELTKPRISIMVLAAVGVAGFVASWGRPDGWLLVHALVGTALIAASSSAANQWLERHSDAYMRRTVDRPLPAGRLSGRTVLIGSAAGLLTGVVYLSATVPWQACAWAVATWVLYVAVYTPMKRRSPWNTGVGAVAGAMPVLIGWTAVGGELGWRSVVLFLLLFFWQFPHFMAIAWLYRDDYRRAGLRMLTVVDPSGRQAGIQSVLGALAMLPVSLTPALGLRSVAGVVLLLATLALGLLLILAAIRFLVAVMTEGDLDSAPSLRVPTPPLVRNSRGMRAARTLLRISLIYLPALFALLMITSCFRS